MPAERGHFGLEERTYTHAPFHFEGGDDFSLLGLVARLGVVAALSWWTGINLLKVIAGFLGLD